MRIRKLDLSSDTWLKWHDFSVKAWGKDNALSFKNHYKWMFQFGDSWMIVDDDKFIGHYGCLKSFVVLDGEQYEIAWFISGMILPEYRNQGLGTTIVKKLLDEYQIVGVIGYNDGVGKVYDRCGLNTFNGVSARRYIKILDEQESLKLAYKEFDAEDVSLEEVNPPRICNAMDKNWLRMRFSNHPYLDYLITRGKYGEIIYRIEHFYNQDGTLVTEKPVARILGWNGERPNELFFYAEDIANDYKCCMVEYQEIGNQANNALYQNYWVELKGDNWTAFPNYSSPAADTPNHEKLVLGSGNPDINRKIFELNENDISFTRMDSDRDRWNKV